MKIDSIKSNYLNVKPQQKRENSVAFQGSAASMAEQIIEILPQKNILKFMKKLEWMKGEIGGVAMTALGTGLVAPWPIAYNPFVRAPKGASEEEKENVKNTKAYTAWRQPISAVLAGIFQVLALTPIDKVLDHLYNDPRYAKYWDIDTNQSLLNNKGYLTRQVKKELKADPKNKDLSKAAFEAEVNKGVKAIEENQIATLGKRIQGSHRIEVYKDHFIDNDKVARMVNSQIDSYIDDARKLKIDKKGLDFYTQRAKVLIDNEARLRKIFTDLPQDEAELLKRLKVLSSAETNQDIKTILDEIINKPADIQGSRIERTLKRIDKIKQMCGGEFASDKYLDAMQKRNGLLDGIISGFEKIKIADVEKATPETIKEAIEEAIKRCKFEEGNKLMYSVLHDTTTFSTNEAELTEKVYQDIAKKYKKFVQDSYKSPNQLWKIAIGVFITLPITCNVLNWVYPRFMNAVFPKLAGAKAKSKEAEQNKEVK